MSLRMSRTKTCSLSHWQVNKKGKKMSETDYKAKYLEARYQLLLVLGLLNQIMDQQCGYCLEEDLTATVRSLLKKYNG